jgi:hypothetical protein
MRMVRRCEENYLQMGRMHNGTWWHDAARSMQAEKAVFISAFIVRKLSESGQLSVQVEDLKIDVTAYPLRSSDDVPDSLNWEEITEFYDIEQGKAEEVPIRHLMNWIIHSYVFLVEVRSDHAGSSSLSAFYCNSDRLRSNRVIRVPWDSFRDVLNRVAADDVISTFMLRDGRGGEVQLRSAVPITDHIRSTFLRKHAKAVAEIGRNIADAWPPPAPPSPE